MKLARVIRMRSSLNKPTKNRKTAAEFVLPAAQWAMFSLKAAGNLSTILLVATLTTSNIVTAAQVQVRNVPSTAVMVTQMNPAYFVNGDDGKRHVEYDLLVTNVFTGPTSLASVDVTDDNGNTLMRLDGDRLVQATQTLLDQKSVKSIASSSAVAIEIDLMLPDNAVVPARLSHHILYKFSAAEPFATAIGSKRIDGPTITINQSEPIVIASPLSGPGWAAYNGCCTPNVHRNTRVAEADHITTSETFAIDWIRIDDGKFYTGNGTRNENFTFFGAPVMSVSDGEVVAVRNDVPESTPFQAPVTLKSPVDYGGNFVYERIRPNVYAFYAHLQPGTVTVKPGDKVKTGFVLGKLGNSGNSTAPHLHFGLLDKPDALLGDSLPFSIDRFKMTGILKIDEAQNQISVAPHILSVSKAFPLLLGIATY